MAKKYYLCAMAGDGTRTNPYRPAIADAVSQAGGEWGTVYEDSTTEKSMVIAVVSDVNGTLLELHEECAKLSTHLGDEFPKARKFMEKLNRTVAGKMKDVQLQNG